MNKFLSLTFLLCAFPLFCTQADDSLNIIKKTHKITLSYSFNDFPFSFVDNEKPVGMAIDLCTNIVHKLEGEFNIPHLAINWVGEKQSETLIKVKEHTVDMTCSAITRTDARNKIYNFSIPYFITTTALLSKKSDAIRDAKQLSGKTIVVISGDSAIARVNRLNQKLDFSLLMVTQSDYASALELLTTGNVKMLATDEVLLAAFKAKDPDNYEISRVDFGDEDVYGLMMAKESIQLTDFVNKALQEIINSGEYKSLYDKWFMSPIPPSQTNLHMPMNKPLQRYIKIDEPGVSYRVWAP